MLVRTAEPVRHVERMLQASVQRRRRRRVESNNEPVASATTQQAVSAAPGSDHAWMASWGGPVPAANVRRVRAGSVLVQGVAYLLSATARIQDLDTSRRPP